jgi:hypothetical protein
MLMHTHLLPVALLAHHSSCIEVLLRQLLVRYIPSAVLSTHSHAHPLQPTPTPHTTRTPPPTHTHHQGATPVAGRHGGVF